MSSEINQKYAEAGRITKEVRTLVENHADWRGTSYLELCNFVEDNFKRLGGDAAFPTNICADSSAAHYTAEIEDQRVVESTVKLLKVDLGAHVEGFPADSSTTICYEDDLLDMVQAVKAAQIEATRLVKADGRTNEVGKLVQAIAERRGYLPIENLSGHSVDEYVVHSGVSIPSVWYPSNEKFSLGKVYAVEEFFTTKDGSGVVVEGKAKNIYSVVSRRRTGKANLDKFVDLVWNKRKTLPFALRWYGDEFPKKELEEMIALLLKLRVVRAYPELVESRGSPVAQAENTVGLLSTGPVVLT